MQKIYIDLIMSSKTKTDGEMFYEWWKDKINDAVIDDFIVDYNTKIITYKPLIDISCPAEIRIKEKIEELGFDFLKELKKL